MATPLKTNVISIVPSVGLCVSCSTSSAQKYYILKKSGEKGPSFEIVSEVYDTSFASEQNYGSYVCKACYRLLKRIIDTSEALKKLVTSVKAKTQSLHNKKVEKRVITRTPNSKGKRIFVSPCLQQTSRNALTSIQNKTNVFSEQSSQASGESVSDGLKCLTPKTKVSSFSNQHSTNASEYVSEGLVSQPTSQIPRLKFLTPKSKVCLFSNRNSEVVNSSGEYVSEGLFSPSTSRIPRLKCLTPKSKVCLFSKQNSEVVNSSEKVQKSEPVKSEKFTQTEQHLSAVPPNYEGNSKRHALVKYRTNNLKDCLTTVLTKLCNGSVQSAVELLLHNKSEHIRRQTRTGINSVIHKECSHLCKQKKSSMKKKPVDLNNFEFRKLQEEYEKQIPTTWGILKSVAQNKNKESDDVKITTACSILLHSRNVYLNALQHCVSICLYNNQLQKEGFMILSKLGITTSHVSLNNALNKVKRNVDEILLNWKQGIETPGNRCDHNYALIEETDTKKVSVCALDHDYVHRNTQDMYKYPCDIQDSGYRFNIDNLDFLLQVRNMTQDHQNQSKHYVQLMAIKDRVCCEDLIDDKPIGNLLNVPNSDFLPNGEDISSLRDDIITVVSHILLENIPAFSIFKGVLTHGFEHEYSEEMKKKSVVLPLGILAKNENKMNDMIEILEYLQNYVPNARSAEEIGNVDLRDDTSAGMRQIPVGGDQLTCERIRGAHMARLDGDTPEERLEGLFCMVEDFHEKMNFLQLIMDKYFKPESCRDAATLYQLKNLLNRRNVSKNVSSNYHAASDFVDLVTECHVIAACLEYCGMENIESQCKKIPVALHIADPNMKRRILRQLVGEIVDTFFLNAITINVDRIEDPASTMDEAPIAQDDAIHNYATNFTKMGLLRKVSVNATRYGDGNRMLRHWKYAMLLYHQGHKVKYRLESFLLLAGVNALLTPRQRHQVISNRFINLQGGEGHNLEGDYVMELLNRYAKSRIKLLGPNHTESCVERIGKTMMFCNDIQDKLEKQINVAPLSREHTPQSLQRDRNSIIQQLTNSRVFQVIPGRSHETFTMENVDILSNVDVHELHKWINEKKREYSFGKYAF